MRSSLASLLLLGSMLFSSACNGSAPSDASVDAQSEHVADAALVDASSTDGALQDGAATLDVTSRDASSQDAPTTDAPSSDGPSSDGASSDALVDSDAAGPACAYENVDDLVVECMGRYRMVQRFDVAPPSAMCPPYWQVGSSPPAATAEQAALNAGCSTACVWRFSLAVSRLYCGHRSGYEVLAESSDRCGELFRFPEGYFASVEEHDRMFPCRDE
jgi:hypothetical protein